jgi:hypothetical protein
LVIAVANAKASAHPVKPDQTRVCAGVCGIAGEKIKECAMRESGQKKAIIQQALVGELKSGGNGWARELVLGWSVSLGRH